MKKTILALTVFCQLSALAQSSPLLEDLKKKDPTFAAQLESMDAESRAAIEKRADRDYKEIRYNENMGQLVKLGVYAQTRGHWLLDIKITRAWLVPTAVALAGIYAHQRHDQLAREAAARASKGLGMTAEQSVVASLSTRARYTAAFLSAGVVGAIGFIASEVKRTNELKSYDARSEEEIIAKYESLLCETNKIAIELGTEQIRHVQTRALPECR